MEPRNHHTMGEKDEGEGAKAIDPLLQLITFFSRSALTDSRCVFVIK